MKRPGRRLSREEAALWARVAQTVKPMAGRLASLPQEGPQPKPDAEAFSPDRSKILPQSIPGASPSFRGDTPSPGRQAPLDRQTLDATWDRRLSRGLVPPDFTIDLHGHSLDAAHHRLDHGLALAIAQGARLVLLITGRPRPSDDHASRGERRGAIRNKFLDWLTAGPHTSHIAAIRPAHQRHGGAGAVYIVLKRLR